MRGLDYKLYGYIRGLREDADDLEERSLEFSRSNHIHVASVMRDVAQDLENMLEGK